MRDIPQEEFEYYIAHQAEIVKGHLEEYVVIKDLSVKGYFKKEMDAFEFMKENKPGTFIVPICKEPGTDIVDYFNDNVAFA